MLNVPFRLVFRRESQYSSVMEAVGVEVGFRPAQLKIWSILEWSLRTVVMKSLHAEAEETSKESRVWEPGTHKESVSSRDGGLMSARASAAPWWESLMAVARPMPDPAPVTIITLPSNGLDILLKYEKR